MLKQGDTVAVTGQKGKNRSWEQKNEPTEDQLDGKYLQEGTAECLVSGNCAQTGGWHLCNFSQGVTVLFCSHSVFYWSFWAPKSDKCSPTNSSEISWQRAGAVPRDLLSSLPPLVISWSFPSWFISAGLGEHPLEELSTWWDTGQPWSGMWPRFPCREDEFFSLRPKAEEL